MYELTKQNLIDTFSKAKSLLSPYVAVKIQMQGFPEPEVIINQYGNIDTKLEYYNNTYDEFLNHKYAKGIKIIDVTFGDSYEEIQKCFE